MTYSKLIASFLVLCIAFLLSVRLFGIFSMTFDFVLAALITLSFFLGFLELTALAVFVAFILNWQPIPSVELLILVAVPLFLSFFRKIIFSLEGWLSSSFATIGGILILYLIPHASLIFTNPRGPSEALPVLFWDVMGSVLFGIAVFWTMHSVYGEKI